MIPFTQTSCMGCTERVVGCHSTCERYKHDKEIHEEIVRRADEGHEADNYQMATICHQRSQLALRKRKHLTYKRYYK